VKAMLIILEQFMQKSEIKYLFCTRKYTDTISDMRTIQFREAICEAMSEEMRNDETVYLMGEEVAEYNGAYKASKGMLAEFGEKE
jgi:pyruvate dehydrogenase E1 component beta subunit